MWYYLLSGQRVGPVGEDMVRALIKNGIITRQTLVWKGGMQDWTPAGETELADDLPPVTSNSGLALYQPQSFKTLWLWCACLFGAGLPLCFIIIGAVPLIASLVIGMILLYRYWRIIQDGKARTSPGKAVGFCFIPLFNLYWSFEALFGLAKDMNAYCDERGIAGSRVNEKLALLSCVLPLTGIIPYVGIVTVIAGIVICFVLFKQLSDTAARIMETKNR